MTDNENGEVLRAYWAKEIADLLDVTTSNLRRWSIDLEKAGYRFYRDEHNRRAYFEKDIMPLRKLKEFLANQMSKDDAVKAVVSMFPQSDHAVITTPVNDDLIQISKRELQEIVKEAIENEREVILQAIEAKMNDVVEQRDRHLTHQLNKTLEERKQIAATLENQEETKSWWKKAFGWGK